MSLRRTPTFVAVLVVVSWLAGPPAVSAQPAPADGVPLRLVIAGLVHGHVDAFLGYTKIAPVEIVGVYEPDAALRARELEAAGLPVSLGAADLDELLARTRPEAVAIFSTTADHRRLVEIAARHKVHAMMEKPLAVSVAEAKAMAAAADAAGIHVLVNYETTWYPTLGTVWRLMKKDAAGGAIRKIVSMHGHPGPKEIGADADFLAWVTDPARSGAGALYDMGCYGATLITWLLDGARPLSVRALTQHFKPSVYPNVDDEATILLEYAGAQGIIQASWNWPVDRKDLEVYGERAYVIATGSDQVRARMPDEPERRAASSALSPAEADPISYLTAIVRGTLRPEGRSSLANNLIVTEILEAARESARTGQAVRLNARSAQEVASLVGYDSDAAFHRAFKRATGLAPGSWRRQQANLLQGDGDLPDASRHARAR
jgi:predicted dehydrogenase